MHANKVSVKSRPLPMNLLLLSPEELDDENCCCLTGRRHLHLTSVLRCEIGGRLRAGVINCGYGTATVLHRSADSTRLHFELERCCETPTFKTLLLAVARPKVLSRCLQHAAALGYERILLLRTHRVDKAHLHSHRLHELRYQDDLRLGLEQARRVRLPVVQLFPRFRPFVEDELTGQVTAAVRVVAHPTAPAPNRERLANLAGATACRTGYALAIGPEGGFVPFEIESLQRCGFLASSFGPAPLRVESALSYITGQLDCLTAAPPDASPAPDVAPPSLPPNTPAAVEDANRASTPTLHSLGTDR